MDTKNKKDLDKKYGKMTLSRFLKAYRLTEDLTQVELAEILGWSKGNICDIENGRRSVGIERAIILSEKLNIPLEYILEIILNEQLQNAGIENLINLSFEKKKKAA